MRSTRLALVLLLLAAPAHAKRLWTFGAEENNLGVHIFNVTAGSPSIGTTTVHSGVYSLNLPNAADVTRRLDGRSGATEKTSGSLFYRLYFRITAAGTNTSFAGLLSNNAGTAGAGALVMDFQPSTSLLRLRNGITSTVSVSTVTLSTDTWYRAELRHLLDDSAGEMELRLYLGDSTSTLETPLTITGEDTLPVSILRLARIISTDPVGGNVGADFILDDIAINDESGSVDNTWPGPGKVALAVPGGNASATWTANGCANNWECVDDLPGTLDDTTTYNSVTTGSTQELYTLATLPAEIPSDATMLSFYVNVRMGGQSATGTNTGAVIVRDDGGSTTFGTIAGFCDTTGWIAHHLYEIPAISIIGKTKAQVQDYDIGAASSALNAAGACRNTGSWANIEWLETPAVTGCGTTVALTGAGCK